MPDTHVPFKRAVGIPALRQPFFKRGQAPFLLYQIKAAVLVNSDPRRVIAPVFQLF